MADDLAPSAKVMKALLGKLHMILWVARKRGR
jgi:hypothetical protein